MLTPTHICDDVSVFTRLYRVSLLIWLVLYSLVFWWRAQLALLVWTLNLKKYFLSIHDNLGDFNRNFRLTIASSLITQWKLNPYYSGFCDILESYPPSPKPACGRRQVPYCITLRNEERKRVVLDSFLSIPAVQWGIHVSHSLLNIHTHLKNSALLYLVKERDQMSFL